MNGSSIQHMMNIEPWNTKETNRLHKKTKHKQISKFVAFEMKIDCSVCCSTANVLENNGKF